MGRPRKKKRVRCGYLARLGLAHIRQDRADEEREAEALRAVRTTRAHRTAVNRHKKTPAKRPAKKRRLWTPTDVWCDRVRALPARRAAASTAFRDSVPRPAYRLPERAMPRWARQDLGQKLPASDGRGPNGPLVYHRGPMTADPFRPTALLSTTAPSPSPPRFTLDDPYMRDAPRHEYNALHDPHLKRWLTSAGRCAFLRRQGLVTDRLDVVCTLREHNEYRRALGRRHDDAIAAAARDENELDLEMNRIIAAVYNHGGNMVKLLRRSNAAGPKKRVTFVDNKPRKRRPAPKCGTGTSARMTDGPVDIHQLRTYTEFGRRPDGRPDYTKYLGTYMKGCKADYYLLPDAKRFFARRPVEAKPQPAKPTDDDDDEEFNRKYRPISLKRRIKILLDSMKL